LITRVTASIKPKALILGFLFASKTGSLDIRSLIRGAGVFGIQPNSVRVSVARLGADGDIESPKRGVYRIGNKALRLANEAACWPERLHLLRDWSGDFLVVHTGHLPRGDKTLLQQGEKALKLLGFVPWQDGLYLRPDNIEQDAQGVRAHLQRLGLDAQAPVFVGSGFASEDLGSIRALWDTDALLQHYVQRAEQLLKWIGQAESLELETAARESWLLGATAIRTVVYDPLLPGEWLDGDARNRYVDSVKKIDQTGKAIWSRFLGD
jgi:phenylacetic acid degradation operon negative regulatory protein